VLDDKDGDSTGWAVGGKVGEPHRLTLLPPAPLDVPEGFQLVLRLEQLSQHERHTLGRFRVGVSDDRIYEQLADALLTPGVQTGWTELRADLSAYAGWQWSLFYRPEQRRWRLVLSADAVTGVRTRGAWGAPGIEGDRAAAREHVERAARMSSADRNQGADPR